MQLKILNKYLLLFFLGGLAFSSCKKDNGNSTLSANDIANVRAKLIGTWLYPVQTLHVTDASGKRLQPDKITAGTAFTFDGSNNVLVIYDLTTTVAGTYTLNSAGNMVSVAITLNNGKQLSYGISQLNNSNLTLSATGTTAAVQGQQHVSITLKKQTSYDMTGNMVTIGAQSDSLFTITVYETHKGGSQTLMGMGQSVKTYNDSFSGQSGDHIGIQVVGQPASINFYGFYNGFPFAGTTLYLQNNITTSSNSGWDIP